MQSQDAVSALYSEKERTALHEAAHAVINVSTGIRFRYVTITPRSSRISGHVMLSSRSYREMRQSGEWEREAISDAAGIIAEDLAVSGELRSTPHRTWLRKQLVRDCGRSDMQSFRRVTQLAWMAEQMEPGWSSVPVYDEDTPLDVAKRAWRTAVLLVARHWESIEDVAYELLVVKPTLTYAEVVEVILTGGSQLLDEKEVLNYLETEDWEPWFATLARIRWDPSEKWYARVRSDVVRHKEEVARYEAKYGKRQSMWG